LATASTADALASPTIENSNRLVGWLRRIDELKRALQAA
jgi:hypothetical protein